MNADHHGLTLREMPRDDYRTARWAEDSAARVDRWILWMTLIALPLCAYSLLIRV